jgi:3-phosphoshikimate 1-carboxyvinyltransferase
MKLRVFGTDYIKGEITVPGDKSISHRAAIIGAIAEGQTVVENFSMCADCKDTLQCMQKLGVEIDNEKNNVVLNGKGLFGLSEPNDVIYCGNSGTTMRLLCGLLAAQNFLSILNGDDSLNRRPMGRIIQPLKLMGARISARSGDRFAPICINGQKLSGVEYQLPVASAQVKSAMVLAGLHVKGTQIVIEPTASRDHTERMLELFGVDIKCQKGRIILGHRRQPKACELKIPGDISSAAYFIALASIAKDARIMIHDVGVNPTRTGIIHVLKKMGVEITVLNERIVSNEQIADLSIRNGRLKAIEISDSLIPLVIDELPIVAVAATQAAGTTIVQGAKELRVKETDRIKAIVMGLRNMGAEIEEKEDGFIIEGPTRLKGAVCESFNDHRIAMSLTIAGLAAEGMTEICGAECIDTSFPEFMKIVKETCGENSITSEK